MKAKFKNLAEWSIHIAFFTFMGIITVAFLIIHAAISIFEIPHKLCAKNDDPKLTEKREHDEYYHHYL